MEEPCCCTSHDTELPFLNQASGSIGLDTALQELKQLTFVPEPKQPEILQEKMKRQRLSNSMSSPSSPPVCYVQMNSKFVTKFEVKSAFVCKKYYSLSKRRKRILELGRPYELPMRSKAEDALQPVPASSLPVAATTERAGSPPVVSRQDSGNKSNPSSPVKSQKSLSSSEVTLVRSRSLDDLDISKLQLGDCEPVGSCCFNNRFDIDNVSQRISKLHVN